MQNPIAQRDSFGCGIACIAFITKTSYAKAKASYFKNKKSASTFGYLCKDLVSALSRAKKRYGYKYTKSRAKFRNNVIVFIKRSKRYPAGHYLVKTDKGWMDPWINFDANKNNVEKAYAGFRKRLPGKPIYIIFPIASIVK